MSDVEASPTQGLICIHRPQCDGCPLFERYLSADRDEVLDQKWQRLADGLHHYPELAQIEPSPLLMAPSELGYRNRARLVVDRGAASPEGLWGFYQAKSRAILPIVRCLIHAPEVEQTLDALKPLLWESALRLSCRFVEARVLDAQALVTLCLDEPSSAEDEAQVLALAEQLGAALVSQLEPGLNVSLALSLGGNPNVVLSGRQVLVLGEDALRVKLSNGRELKLPIGAFFQLNTSQLEQVHALMREWVGALEPGSSVVDLYCGVGAHGLALCPDDGVLLGADVNPQAIQAAQQSAAQANVKAELVALHDEQLAGWLTEALSQHKPSLLILNPARAGVHGALVAALGRAANASLRLLYLSCEPATLRRDLARLLRQGFVLERLCPIDMMPMTEQVESLALLRYAPDVARASALEEAFALEPSSPRRFSLGVSGPALEPSQLETPAQSSQWWALVWGRAPKSGHLPAPKGAPKPAPTIMASREAYSGRVSLLSLQVEGDDELAVRQRLRAWGYPVVGDERYGDRKRNALFARYAYGDRVALHCEQLRVEDGCIEAPLPGIFHAWLALMT